MHTVTFVTALSPPQSFTWLPKKHQVVCYIAINIVVRSEKDTHQVMFLLQSAFGYDGKNTTAIQLKRKAESVTRR